MIYCITVLNIKSQQNLTIKKQILLFISSKEIKGMLGRVYVLNSIELYKTFVSSIQKIVKIPLDSHDTRNVLGVNVTSESTKKAYKSYYYLRQTV